MWTSCNGGAYGAPFEANKDANFVDDNDEDDTCGDGNSDDVTKITCSCLQNSIWVVF